MTRRPLASPQPRPSEHLHQKATTEDAPAARNASRDEARFDERADKPELDPLDPEMRRAAQLAPPQLAPPAQTTAAAPLGQEDVAPRARVSMEELLPQLVKRIAWAGDRRRRSVQLELGAGRHAGTVVTVHSDDGRVRVELAGTGADELRERIRRRLERNGLDVESVT